MSIKKFLKPSMIPVFLLGAIVGAGLIYLVKPYEIKLDEENTSLQASQTLERQNEESTPAEGELSPHTVASRPQGYVNKDIKIKGYINETSQGSYIVVSQKIEEPLSVALDFSKSQVDPKNFANKLVSDPKNFTPQENKGPFVVSGQLKENKQDNKYTFVFEVKSVD